MGVLGWVTAGRLEVLTRSDPIPGPREEGWTHKNDSSFTTRFYLVKCFGKYCLQCVETGTTLGIPCYWQHSRFSTSDIPQLREIAPDLVQWLDEVEELMET